MNRDIQLSPKVRFSKSLRLCVSAGKRKKGFPQRHRDTENRTGQNSAHLRPLCEVKIRTADKNLNNERAESYDFQLVFLLARILLWYMRKELTMTETNATSEYCCTCQSWHGIRKYDPRRGKVKYENRAPDTPCNMNYRKPGACPKGNCRGYVRWVELG